MVWVVWVVCMDWSLGIMGLLFVPVLVDISALRSPVYSHGCHICGFWIYTFTLMNVFAQLAMLPIDYLVHCSRSASNLWT